MNDPLVDKSRSEAPEAVADDLRAELDRRLAAYHADPASARPWDEIKSELFGSQ
ncbi:MAG TPA: addiction module protein [Thermoanaerobaculia bacterium]|nr:addiction module protein [Thermoanaerobaculia bacterium]